MAPGNAPFSRRRPKAARSDDDVSLAGDGRKGHDAVEAEETDASGVEIATWETNSIDFFT